MTLTVFKYDGFDTLFLNTLPHVCCQSTDTRGRWQVKVSYCEERGFSVCVTGNLSSIVWPLVWIDVVFFFHRSFQRFSTKGVSNQGWSILKWDSSCICKINPRWMLYFATCWTKCLCANWCGEIAAGVFLVCTICAGECDINEEMLKEMKSLVLYSMYVKCCLVV